MRELLGLPKDFPEVGMSDAEADGRRFELMQFEIKTDSVGDILHLVTELIQKDVLQ